VRHNLPLETTRLIGRERDIVSVAELLAGARFVSLVGTGGIGKTRLAVALADSLAGRFPDGAWLVELAAIADADALAGAIASAVGLSDHAGRSPHESLVAGLRSRRLLLVLDNCEHVLVPIARIASDVLAGCAGVTLLATSREPLRVRGERVWRVAPLSLPTDDSPAALESSESVALFIERATAVCPDFTVRPLDASALAAICRRLDGIPLALELAAARVGTLSLKALDRALDDRFRVLTGGERLAAPRHQALRTTIAWSCDLLEPRERALFARTGIFVDGFTLDALVEVCADDMLGELHIFGGVSSLVDKSLVLAVVGETVTRYHLFESTLAFARELLEQSGEHDPQARRHAAYFGDFVRTHAWEMWQSPAAAIVAEVAPELENIRAALRRCFDDAQDRAVGARLVVDSAPLFRQLDRRVELEARLDALLRTSKSPLSPEIEAAANYELLYSMYLAPERQRAAGERAVALLKQSGASARFAHASALLAHNLAVCFGRYAIRKRARLSNMR
jgi:predicted ATPase